MLLKGISCVVLGYSRLDGGAARAREGTGNLFSDFIRGRPIAFLQDIYKACSLYIVCNIVFTPGRLSVSIITRKVMDGGSTPPKDHSFKFCW